MSVEVTIDKLHPTLQRLAREHLHRAELAGLVVVMTAGFRSPAEQLALYAKGREWQHGQWILVDASQVVTHALPEHGPHCRGAAYDLCPLVNEHCAWDRLDLFQRLGEIGEGLGLTWGGRWAKLKDMPHFELVGWKLLPYPPEHP